MVYSRNQRLTNKTRKGVAIMQVNTLEAKTNLSNLIRLIETGKKNTIIIARYGKPIVKMTAYQETPVSRRIGIAKGKLKTPEDLDKHNDEITELFGDEKSLCICSLTRSF